MRAATMVLALASFALALYTAVRVHRLTHGATRMTTKAEFDDVVTRFNAATNAIAARITALEGQIASAGLPAEQEATLLAELHSIAAGLEALGADPTNPVPEPDPGPVDPV